MLLVSHEPRGRTYLFIRSKLFWRYIDSHGFIIFLIRVNPFNLLVQACDIVITDTSEWANTWDEGRGAYRFRFLSWLIPVYPPLHISDSAMVPTLNLNRRGGDNLLFHKSARSFADPLSIGGISNTPSGQPSFFHAAYISAKYHCDNEGSYVMRFTSDD